MKRLIIGKNSFVVGQVRPHLDERFDFISHIQIDDISFDIYEFVFVFSWTNDVESMTSVLSKIDHGKLVFVSTLAVYANLFSKQYSSYPKAKLVIEDRVLAAGGSIMRLGFFDTTSLDAVSTPLPMTTPKMLAAFLKRTSFIGVQEVYKLQPGKGVIDIRKQRLINNLMCMPTTRLFIDTIAIIRGNKIRNYSRDLVQIYAGCVQAGYGAIGGYRAYTEKYDGLVIVADRDKNEEINDNGFRRTIVPRSPMGLGLNWHGVYIDGFKKCVPRVVRRYRPPQNAIKAEVVALDFDKMVVELKSSSHPSNKFFVPFSQLSLALGCLENLRLLGEYFLPDEVLTAHDHEIGFVGSIAFEEAAKFGLVGCFGPFIYNKSVKLQDSILIDLRPSSGKVPDVNNDLDLLNNRIHTIFKKLILSFDIGKINQSFFNKFGIGCYTRRMDVFVQIVSRNCVSISKQGMIRKRLTHKDVSDIVTTALNEFDSFLPISKPVLVDGLHYQGGEALFLNSEFAKLIEDKVLKILGSPSRLTFDATHNTERLKQISEV